ncbi:MAG: DUF6152 family protein [Hyphomicrobiaceae bacterium]|jgi:hypothetical protein
MLSRLGLSLLMFLAAMLPASAHHGWGSYDSSKTVTVEGKILNASYENPHVTVTVEGQDKTWIIILAPVSRMKARGATADLIETGKVIQAIGYVSTRDPNELRAERIIVDGKTFEMR